MTPRYFLDSRAQLWRTDDEGKTWRLACWFDRPKPRGVLVALREAVPDPTCPPHTYVKIDTTTVGDLESSHAYGRCSLCGKIPPPGWPFDKMTLDADSRTTRVRDGCIEFSDTPEQCCRWYIAGTQTHHALDCPEWRGAVTGPWPIGEPIPSSVQRPGEVGKHVHYVPGE